MGRQGGPICHRYQAIVCEGGGWYAGPANNVAPTRRKARRCGGVGPQDDTFGPPGKHSFFLFSILYFQNSIYKFKPNQILFLRFKYKVNVQHKTSMNACISLIIYLLTIIHF